MKKLLSKCVCVFYVHIKNCSFLFLCILFLNQSCPHHFTLVSYSTILLTTQKSSIRRRWNCFSNHQNWDRPSSTYLGMFANTWLVFSQLRCLNNLLIRKPYRPDWLKMTQNDFRHCLLLAFPNVPQPDELPTQVTVAQTVLWDVIFWLNFNHLQPYTLYAISNTVVDVVVVVSVFHYKWSHYIKDTSAMCKTQDS